MWGGTAETNRFPVATLTFWANAKELWSSHKLEGYAEIRQSEGFIYLDHSGPCLMPSSGFPSHVVHAGALACKINACLCPHHFPLFPFLQLWQSHWAAFPIALPSVLTSLRITQLNIIWIETESLIPCHRAALGALPLLELLNTVVLGLCLQYMNWERSHLNHTDVLWHLSSHASLCNCLDYLHVSMVTLECELQKPALYFIQYCISKNRSCESAGPP